MRDNGRRRTPPWSPSCPARAADSRHVRGAAHACRTEPAGGRAFRPPPRFRSRSRHSAGRQPHRHRPTEAIVTGYPTVQERAAALFIRRGGSATGCAPLGRFCVRRRRADSFIGMKLYLPARPKVRYQASRRMECRSAALLRLSHRTLSRQWSAVMLHLRIITPPVLQELIEDPGVTHITADLGAATEPPGDLVACDVVRASVNPLLRRLRAAGVGDRGGITVTELEAVVSAAADNAQAEILTPEIDTVVWAEVSARTSDDSAFSVSFGVLMVLAGILAAIAVVTNNPVLVVGAMIVSPDYGPMAALSVALVNRAFGPAWKSLRALALGFPMAALAAFLIILVA